MYVCKKIFPQSIHCGVDIDFIVGQAVSVYCCYFMRYAMFRRYKFAVVVDNCTCKLPDAMS